MSTSLSLLREQRGSTLAGIANARNQIDILNSKVIRLKDAARELEASITEMETTKRSIDNLPVDENRWKGAKVTEFNKYYNVYKSSIRSFILKTEDVKQRIEEDIMLYERKINSYETGIMSLQNTLTSIDREISRKE
ncbi:YwqH-like family protein [Virgibacillus chiguensis]|uniref:Uncharacterized protein n=1 Tax=Virgibacillus chiguensis TaxID=411959 RepID=A0A1M5NTC9_9BACI|nr:DUF5082 family protein [Virgibacillus chiguensis]SHG92821.1 protein of unknown function [Virgibacillus chiguensis]